MGQKDHGWVWILLCWSPVGILFVLFCARYLSLHLVPSLIMKTKQSKTSPALCCSPCLGRSLAGYQCSLKVASPYPSCSAMGDGQWVMGDGPGHGCNRSVGAISNQETCRSVSGPSGSLIPVLRDFISLATRKMMMIENYKQGKVILLVVIAKNEAMFQDHVLH